MKSQLEDNTIHLGICMAGAVSAGAYTAGVMDYLLETLELWEEAKQKGEPVPTHHVKISAISGSSAGGIISVMLPKIFCAGKRPHVSLNIDQSEAQKSQNLLYNTWVNFSLPPDKDILDEIMSPDDIEKNGGLHSLLNSDFKKRIAQEILEKTPVSADGMPAYVETNMDVIVGITNTSGYTFNIPFKNNGGKIKDNAYTVVTHRDLAHFVTTSQYDPQNELHRGKFPYDPCLTSEDGMKTISDAARGTSAFPVGFMAEKMHRPGHILIHNELLFQNQSTGIGKIIPEELIQEAKKKKLKENEFEFQTVNVDAGTVNNEPFEHLRTVMEQRYYPKKGEEFEAANKDKKNFRSSLLLIDPLPDTISSNQFQETGLGQIIPQLLKLLQNQAKFKPDLITDAIDEDDFSKFIIAPRRETKNKEKINGYKALASGFLGAFGGFLSKDFLKHDYYLGRKNCQSFLQHHFVIESDTQNPIFIAAYQDEAVRKRFLYTKGRKQYLPIIPDMKYRTHIGSFEYEKNPSQEDLNVEKIMDYDALPKIDEKKLSKWRGMIRHRIRVLIWVQIKQSCSKQKNVPPTTKPFLNVFEKIILVIYLLTFKIWGLSQSLTDLIRNELITYHLYRKDS